MVAGNIEVEDLIEKVELMIKSNFINVVQIAGIDLVTVVE